jgi:hypothetical protein
MNVGWLGMTLTLSGVVCMAWFPSFARYSLYVFCTSALVWLAHGVAIHDRPLVLTQLALFGINAVGIYRWRNK